MIKNVKKIYKYLVGDAPTEVEKRGQLKGKVNQANTFGAIHKEENRMNARVSYQYPKANFRFPLISDDEVEKQIIRKQPRRKEEPMKKEVQVHTSKKVEPSKPKQSFKATEVPSPIHGYNQRKTEQEIIEFEITSSFTITPVKDLHAEIVTNEPDNQKVQDDLSDYYHVIKDHSDENLYENESVKEEIIEVALTEEEVYRDTTNYAEVKDELIIEEEIRISDVEESFIDVESHIFEDEISFIDVEETEPQNNLELLVADQIPDQEERRNSTRKHVPFNVIMLKQDREKLKEKKVEIVKHSSSYQFPPLHFLTVPKHDVTTDNKWLAEQRELLDVTLKNFNVKANVVNVTQGPSVTRFEVHPEPGVKVNKITNLSDDIKLSLSARDIRIEAPIPGKNTIGIEVPNKISKPVLLSEIINSQAFRANPSPLTVALGLDISGNPIVTDLKKMPHGLIAGATGSGKSVCINSMLVSLLYKASPHEVKLLLIDPKMVELAPYNHIPHLVCPVITDVKAATAALKWAVDEMERRYERLAHAGARDINRYNELVREHNEPSGEMPFLVIIIDELADLMMVAPGEVEEYICRIAQKARACGIHLLLATQRPSVDVITGLIKANVPTRIAFSVSSQIDSRTIVDSSGAEKLLGKGDMLFLENGSSKPVRLQGNFVSDGEIEAAVEFVKAQQKPEYLFEQQELISKSAFIQEEDDLFVEACEFVIDHGGASSSSLQRRFRIGYNRAARLIEMMEDQGIVSQQKGSKPRDVLVTEEQLLEIQDTKSMPTY
ncbi:DNA translocase FtsK [Bacillus sp. DJP31]|uniref:DNA translocase FtsK n=1 Tax=Bacillus sp. DJP31 TaxID=3409789 RepID=UPI003BB5620D